MSRIPLLPVIAVTLVSGLSAQQSVRPARVLRDVAILSSDAMQGRRTCSAGNDSAAAWLAARLRELRAEPAGDSGSYLQRWTTGSTTATRQAGIDNCPTANVVARFPGRGNLAGQTLIIGAHFDHLGTSRFGSMAADSGQIHNGADDNASGTALVIEMARLLSRDRALRDARPRRAVILALWSGEEQGVLGSTYFAGTMTIPRDSIVAYLNFDMVGRMRGGRVIALGERTAEEWSELLDSANLVMRFNLAASGDGWGPSDHSSFYARRIPVLHFFTDLHEDYHRPSDDVERINASGIVQIADYTAELIRLLDRRRGLTFVDVPPPAPVAANTSGRPRPSLGTIPEMSSEPGGVLLSGVRPGSPADSAGMRAGDVLIAIGTHTIGNLQDFQNALTAHAAGDRVEVRWRRGSETLTATVVLAARN